MEFVIRIYSTHAYDPSFKDTLSDRLFLNIG